MDAMNQEQSQKPTASHYLVIAPLPRSMERDGVPRYALHEAIIECEDKIDVPGLEHYVAALVPAASLSKTVVIHKFFTPVDSSSVMRIPFHLVGALRHQCTGAERGRTLQMAVT